MQETWVQSLGWEDPLEKGKAAHSSTLAWRSPWTVHSSWGCKESDPTAQPSLSLRSPQCSLLRMLSSPGALPEGVTSYAAHTWPWPVHTLACLWHLVPPCAGPCAHLDRLFCEKPALTSPQVLQILLLCRDSVCAGHKATAWRPIVSSYLLQTCSEGIFYRSVL